MTDSFRHSNVWKFTIDNTRDFNVLSIYLIRIVNQLLVLSVNSIICCFAMSPVRKCRHFHFRNIHFANYPKIFKQ